MFGFKISSYKSEVINVSDLLKIVSENEILGARKEKLGHEAGHVSWTKEAACQKYIVFMDIQRCK